MAQSPYYKALMPFHFGQEPEEPEVQVPYAPGVSPSLPTAQPVMNSMPNPGAPASFSQSPDFEMMKNYFSKQYPEMFQRAANQFEDNNVTSDDRAAVDEQSKLLKLGAGLSKASAQIGNVNGQALTTTAPETLGGYAQDLKTDLAQKDKLAEQGRQDVFSTIKGAQELRTSGLDEAKRTQELQRTASESDPNSAQSKAARALMVNYGLELPDSVSYAYIQKEFNPGEMFKQKVQQSYEKEKQQREFENQKTLKAMEIDAKNKNNNNTTIQDKTSVEDLSKKIAASVSGANMIQGFLTRFDLIQNDPSLTKEQKDIQLTQIGQQMIKPLNSMVSADAVGAQEAERLANELEPWTIKSPSGWPRYGKDLPNFKIRAEAAVESARNFAKENQKLVDQISGQQSRTSGVINNLVPDAGTETKQPRRQYVPGMGGG